MECKQNTIDTILEEFLKREVAATDERIASIRHFVNALQNEVAGYTASSFDEKSQLGRTELAKLIDDMTGIYSEELALLATKRSRIYAHLTSVSVAMCNGESAQSRGIYLN